MSKFTKEMVNDYADKLLIGLTEEENKLKDVMELYVTKGFSNENPWNIINIAKIVQ